MNNEKAILEKLEQIEKRQAQRRNQLEEMKKETQDKLGKLKSESSKRLGKSLWLRTGMMTVAVMVLLIVFNLILRSKFGSLGSFNDAVRQSVFVLPFLPFAFVLVYFINRRNKNSAAKLCEALEAVAGGDYSVRLEGNIAGPYKKAFEDFNRMCDAVSDVNSDLQSAVDIANEANEAKSVFLANMSHEIRTPINAVLGLNEMIIRESRESKIRDYGKDIKSAGKTLLSLVNDVLDTSRIEAGKLEIIPVKYDLSSLVNDIMNMNLTRANDKGLNFSVKVDEKTPHLLKGDDNRIKQCILNILSNAIKYTDNGSVTMEIGFAKLTNKEILLSVSITDTGRGMREEDLEKLCTPFERLEEGKSKNIEGTGLGMNITKNLLDLMESELRVESRYGEGSIFKFSVRQEVIDWQPIGNIEESFSKMREAEEKYKESFRAPNAKLLVVDDSSVNLMIVEGLLKQTQIQLTLVESGEAAIEESKKKKFDLLLIDHMMPGMDGIETLHHMRDDSDSLNKESPMVALTANAISGAKQMYLKEGFNDYLSKPIEPEKLEKAIMGYLPKELIEIGNFESEAVEDLSEDAPFEPDTPQDDFVQKLSTVEGVFTDKGLEYSGSLDLYKKVVTEFADTGAARADTIEGFFEQEDYRNYTIQVHALKSAARIIGATALSQLAAALEDAGNQEDTVRITNATPELLRRYRKLVTDLEGILDSGEDKPEIDSDSLKDALMSIKEMVEGFDFDSVDSVMEELKKYRMPEDFKENYSKLKTLVAEVARDDILILLADVNVRG